MAFAKTHSAQVVGLTPHIIDIEVDLSNGLYSFSMVGLPDKAVEEARDRFSAAIKNSGLKSPKSKNQKVVVSLAPADLKKEGPTFDLGIALAYLKASGALDFNTENKLFLGELSLNGEVRAVRGVLPLVQMAKKKGLVEIFVPKENSKEAALVEGVAIYGITTLKEAIDHLDKKYSVFLLPEEKTELPEEDAENDWLNMHFIQGQESAKRGLEIAAAGGHNVLMYGPPGSGKTLLAKAFCGILPPLSFEEALEVTGIHSIAGTNKGKVILSAPLRTPHHSSSHISIIGGGTIPMPGEITLAHRGVLFLDEFPEFDRRVIEALREPLEEKKISISRAKGSAEFPANVIFLAAMNPCPCGNFGSKKPCVCSPSSLERYKRKISGPVVDRIDIWLEVGEVSHKDLAKNSTSGETTETIRDRVEKARNIQNRRFGKKNSDMSVPEIQEHIKLSKNVSNVLEESAKNLGLSARSYHKIMKLSRTIADLEEKEHIEKEHILDALQYRPRIGAIF